MGEDKAVDLYVLERAFISTHPEAENLFQKVLEGYQSGIGEKWIQVKKRLDEGACSGV